MGDLIVIIIILSIVTGAITKIVIQKRKGDKCIGCPYSQTDKSCCACSYSKKDSA